MNKMVSYVEWVDSKFLFGWQDPDDLAGEPTTIRSIGFVIDEDENKVILATSISDATNNVGSPIIIPRCAIIKQTQVGNMWNDQGMVLGEI